MHAQNSINQKSFEFGENWARFLKTVNEERVIEAEHSLKLMLETESLAGRRFLDIGSGSGLFSLAAMRLGAKLVHSFDFDPQSVACTRELKRRYFPNTQQWTIETGNALDSHYLQHLGKFDFIYAWGVLHHTGNMWQALENAAIPVRKTGKLFISIYNDQGRLSRLWRWVKRIYNTIPPGLRFSVLWPAVLVRWGPTSIRDFLRGRPFDTWRNYKTQRGMSAWHDVVDWVGGYPFEVAKPEEIFDFYLARGFELRRLKTVGGRLGCNEYVFEKRS